MKTSVLFAVIAVGAILGVAGLAIASSTGAGTYGSQARHGDGSGMMGGGHGMMGSGSHQMGSGNQGSCPMGGYHNYSYDYDNDYCPHMG